MSNLEQIVIRQRNFYQTDKTIDYKFRLESLKKLKKAIIANQTKIEDALYKDLNKTASEAYMTEIGLVLSDLTYQIKNLKNNMSKTKVSTPLAQFKGSSYIIPHPYGNTLIISPWNYPILLSLEPLTGALAAGNTVLLKPSEYSPNTSQVIKDMLAEIFPSKYVHVELGDYTVANELLSLKWDYIFFTGGTQIGKIVYEAASKHLTPVTLELGGKSPAIVEESAKIDLSAKRIVFGKFVNCGQTCVAPDYILVNNKIKDKFIEALIKWINVLYPNAINNKDYGKIINEKHFNRLLGYLDNEEIIHGGNSDKDKLKIEPTLVKVNSLDTKLMTEEIFGPILPIIAYDDLDQVFSIIDRNKNPLALYIFTRSKWFENLILKKVQFGGGCVNDTIVHLASNSLGFGGVGNSGIGQYHGKLSFDTFSHYRSVLKKATWIDLPMRYTPYNKSKDKLIKTFLK